MNPDTPKHIHHGKLSGISEYLPLRVPPKQIHVSTRVLEHSFCAVLSIALMVGPACAQAAKHGRTMTGDKGDPAGGRMKSIAQIEAMPWAAVSTDGIMRKTVYSPPLWADVPGGSKNQNDISYSLERDFPKHLLLDQKTIWTSPFRASARDLRWIIPAVVFTGGLIASDSDTAPELRRNVDLNRAQQFSNAGLFAEVALSGSMYAWGRFTSNPHARETGALSAEAFANSLIVTEALKLPLGRQRPLEGDHAGDFFRSGNSFPSGHSMLTWSVASVIAHEYPGTLTKIGVYGLASAVSAARVAGGKHFASDVVIGGTIGWLIGRQVFRDHHDPNLGGANYGAFVRDDSLEVNSHTIPTASAYVPIESVSYRLFDRLIVAGYINSGFTGLRPWTRAECARLLEEAGQNFPNDSDPEYLAIYHELRKEFSGDDEFSNGKGNPFIIIDEVYARGTALSGTPLRDSFHFGQTLYNDYGRPYWAGINVTAGFTSSATAGPFVFHFRGEYQHAPTGRSVDSDEVRQFIARADSTPVRPVLPFAEVNRFRVLEGYAALGWKKMQFTLGKQSLWWGPGESGPLLFSNNAEPFYMLRIAQTEPLRLPGILGWFGPIRWDSYFGKLAGHQFPAGPYTHGQKITFKPTRNLEMGFSRTVMFAGKGRPLTLRSFGNSFFSVGDNPGTTPGALTDVGDRRGGFDFRYRVPKLRDSVTIYGDFFTDDDPSPLAAPQRAAMIPGIYFSRLPGLHNMDLRIEAPTTALPAISDRGGQFFFFNGAFLDGYTNNGNIIGSWIGRQAKGIFAKTQYYLSPTSILAFSYRNSKLDPNFVPQGGTLHDGRVSLDIALASRTTLSSFLQYEQWKIPLLKPGLQQNITASFQIQFRPAWTWK